MKNKILLTALFSLLCLACQTENITEIDLENTPAEVELFAEGIISTKLYERDLAISPRGNEIIFTLSDYRQSVRCLATIKKINGKWTEKQILDFSGNYQDIEPCFSADGNQLFFASNRPVDRDSTRSDFNIWVSNLLNSGWSEPEPLNPNINTDGNEFYPSVSKNGNLYFTAERENGIGSEDIFLSRYADGQYLIPEHLDANINSPVYEFNAYISPDEDLILFSSYGREDDLGGGDLYYSKKDASGRWTPAKNMGPPINSDKLDYCPFIDMARGNFYFTSERFTPVDKRIETVDELENRANSILNGMGNIYRISMKSLLLE
ncbi:MAG: PD40 domain-containing protein [Calditrichaceae bacterium]|nr:PD40 domain-containing protein [Calditrichaceae bacterium]MBN2710125.1 PD40 domain-containing protein [Calditrichaceae bacterium]RQV93428.1 MAG: exo-alpha-sialidase [Calditrichota bacterium]